MTTSDQLATLCRDDGEFRLAARHWEGGLRLEMGDVTLEVALHDGQPFPEKVEAGAGFIGVSGPTEVWDQVLAAVPPRFLNDLTPALYLGLTRTGDDLDYWQYYPAVARAIELLRTAPSLPEDADGPSAAVTDATVTSATAARFDSPVGRYIHLELDGVDHRVYFEEAGTGIPLLLQHTAGSHGSQWRHLFEAPEITDHFRLIAYDLPFHGKSLPPTSGTWWASEYRLTRDFAMSVALTLSGALGLDRPVFMGCSVGGQLALDLARYHPESFRAVISLEPALKVDADRHELEGFWHPQVSNETKARVMYGLTSPTSPEPLRRETVYAYSAGWPATFLGDLHYYLDDHDLREEAAAIDTRGIGVHLLTGEYDYSATIEHGQAVHDAVPGSTFDVMEGLGHFPMSENPDRFLGYLLPVLDKIRSRD